ncbi:hypothetical protein JG687_00004470 [Phytophthora cactorum]|uniref:Uncharacterized protein n=1 Tax=Phytophthora cactorum TaxID=29920 RepID=A0A329SJD9_9STRA|nr:hypothetical protein PC112_g10365 [Phytophthora cactorum]KAG3200068.1 hypothetical protein PC128_g4829 [Phytophthora cactorum]KAG4243184.1 hypothetical protein PC116_g8960 [Phytophthora cactorum]KAG6967102.1 hypothetical protein JG687_00004470 [Phytophthora cactorum]RAW36883.1 hypothetical protein PC110_g6838 [Phytophthora cactorum]
MAVKLRRLKAAEWLVIKCLSTLLDPVAKTIEELGGQNYPTISLVLPAGSTRALPTCVSISEDVETSCW